MRLDRVFVDTNVLISGLVFAGNEFDLLEMARVGTIRLVLAEAVIEEARRVISRRFPEMRDILERFLESADYDWVDRPDQEAIQSASVVLRDPDDAEIVASAMLAEPTVMITGDKDLLTGDVRRVVPACRCADYLREKWA